MIIYPVTYNCVYISNSNLVASFYLGFGQLANCKVKGAEKLFYS
jgi:hypothetical protein